MSEAGVSRKSAIFASSSLWMSNVPQMNRTEDVPAPYLSAPSFTASITEGSSHSPR